MLQCCSHNDDLSRLFDINTKLNELETHLNNGVYISYSLLIFQKHL